MYRVFYTNDVLQRSMVVYMVMALRESNVVISSAIFLKLLEKLRLIQDKGVAAFGILLQVFNLNLKNKTYNLVLSGVNAPREQRGKAPLRERN